MQHNIKDVEIRQASLDDIKLFYPDGSPRTAYSWLALYKGVPACLAGLIVHRSGCIAFSEIAPGIDAPRMTIWRTAKVLFSLIEQLKLPMQAACDIGDTAAHRFVEALGFIAAKRRLQGMEMFLWQQWQQ